MMFWRKKKSEGAARSQALAWYVERLDEAQSAEEGAAFNKWLIADPAHEREYRQLDTLCEDLGAFENAPQIEQAKAYAAQYRAHAAQSRRSWRFGFAGAWQAPAVASVALLVAGWLAVSTGLLSFDDGRYATALGERLTVDLADGSVIHLNTDSSIRVAYSENERRVLLYNGQASFDVAPNSLRPFVVEAGEGIITAIGTIFDVYNSGGEVTVTLIEGIVEVRQRVAALGDSRTALLLSPPTDHTGAEIAVPAAPPAAPGAFAVAELKAGEQISIAAGGGFTPVAQIDVARVTAWEDGMIDLRDTPLRDAILEVNRYSETKLVLIGAGLNDAAVSGIFRVGKPENFVRALEARFGIRATRTGKNLILLRPAPPVVVERQAQP